MFHFASNLHKRVPNYYPKHLFFRWIVIWHICFGDLRQSEKLSEIKPPVVAFRNSRKSSIWSSNCQTLKWYKLLVVSQLKVKISCVLWLCIYEMYTEIQFSGTKIFPPNKNQVETYLVCESKWAMTLNVFEKKQRSRVLICDIAPPTKYKKFWND